MQPASRLVIIGGGYVGLEVAAHAVKRGMRVTANCNASSTVTACRT